MLPILPLRRELEFAYGELAEIAPGIRRIIARNPSPFTLHGTGTYVLGRGSVAVIDPGPADPSHIAALLAGLRGERISHVLVTHTHLDHSPGCRLLARHADAPTYGYGPHGAGRLEADTPVEEGADLEFRPDRRVRHGQRIEGDGWSLECVHTPGHTSNHCCYALDGAGALFSGDHVMGWSTSIVSPPDGNMGDYLASLALLLERDDRIYWPTHGPAVQEPKTLVRAFIAHRRGRERQILDCVGRGQRRIADMLPSMYADLPKRMHPAAARSALAAIEHLIEKGTLVADGEARLDGIYRLA